MRATSVNGQDGPGKSYAECKGAKVYLYAAYTIQKVVRRGFLYACTVEVKVLQILYSRHELDAVYKRTALGVCSA